MPERTGFTVGYDSVVRGAVITFVDITDRKRASAALEEANRQLERRVTQRTGELSVALERLRELSAYLDSVREEERTRIAREVHDELGSLLVALKMDVNWLDRRLGEQQARDAAAAQAMRRQMRAKCGNMSRLIEHAVESVGRIITDLRPSILDHQGLWAALEWQAQEFIDSAELDSELQLHVAAGVQPPDGALAIAVFRIFQEVLSNVARHARAKRVQGLAVDLRLRAFLGRAIEPTRIGRWSSGPTSSNSHEVSSRMRKKLFDHDQVETQLGPQ